MNGYMVYYKEKTATVKECYITNVLIGIEELERMGLEDYIVVKTGRRTMQIKKENFFIEKKYADRRAKEYNIKQTIKNEREKVCYWCNKKLVEKEDITLDHIKPKSKCKTWAEAWNEKNLVLSCYNCNQNKTNLNPRLNLHIQRKAEILKYKTPRQPHNKVCSSFSSKAENAEYITRRDSPFYNVKAFFLRQNYVNLV